MLQSWITLFLLLEGLGLLTKMGAFSLRTRISIQYQMLRYKNYVHPPTFDVDFANVKA